MIDSFADELIRERSLDSLSGSLSESATRFDEPFEENEKRSRRTNSASSANSTNSTDSADGTEAKKAKKAKESQSLEEVSASSSNEFVLILAACLIGISTGFGVVLFNDAVAFIRHIIWDEQTSFSVLDGRQLLSSLEADAFGWLRLVGPPVVGSAVVSGILWLSSGGGSSESMPFRKARERLGRIGSAVVGLGSGVSLGPEGPSVEIGVDLATIFIEQFKSGRQHIASLIAAGSGAGVAAGFNAPISGVFFAVESVLQRESGAWL